MEKLTFFIEDERPNRLEAEIARHKFTNLLEKTREAALRAHLRGELQGVNHCLLLLVHFLLRS